MTAEQSARLEDIRTGPWYERSQFARERLPALSPVELQRFFRSHVGDDIKEPAEITFRGSFDQALEELQLLELAVACGFLPLDAVRTVAESEFTALLFSEPARNYVKLYDYVSVRYLASRISLDLELGKLEPPPVNPQAEVRYAIFLATHYEFIANRQIGTFTMFLDDFYFGERRVNAQFLKAWIAGERDSTLTSEQQMALGDACLGLIQFTETLGDFFLQAPVQERPYFGLAYGYWLSHFFGFRRPGIHYERRATSFEDVQPDSALAMTGTIDVDAERDRFRQGLSTLRAVWDATRHLIESLDKS